MYQANNNPEDTMQNEQVKEVRVNKNGQVEKVMQWPTPENPDKSWGSRGYEREDR